MGILAAATAVACGRPYVGRDGTVLFPQSGTRGASIVTANGLEFRDREDVPDRVVHRDPHEPWRAPVGFILPKSGRFTETSKPTLVATPGLAVVMRPSDTRVPSWGGEVLVRIDIIAPAAQGTARMGERVVIVIDGHSEDTYALASAALAQLAARDRVAVVDTTGTEVVVPMIPAAHRSLAGAAIEKRAGRAVGRRTRSLAATLQLAGSIVKDDARTDLARRILVLSDGRGDAHGTERLSSAAQAELEKLANAGVAVSSVASTPHADSNGVAAIGIAGAGRVSTDPLIDARLAAVREAIPQAGRLNFEDVVLSFEGTPAPSHVLEASGGDVAWRLESGELRLGNVHAGEARTEVVRVTVPPWVAGEPFKFTVTARYNDVARGEELSMQATLPCLYDDDIERIAESRHGDVIAYASALATLRRLDAAFAGAGVSRAGGLKALAQLHARSMTLLARDTRDPAIIEQAEVLNALLSVPDR
jgi:hypothetical protein